MLNIHVSTAQRWRHRFLALPMHQPRALKPFLTNDVVLCIDGNTALAGAACQLGVEHHAVNLSAGIRVDGDWHVQNGNASHSRLKGWVYKFRGVATCYLANYLGWFRALDREHVRGSR